MAIYTLKEAADIVEVFDDFLISKGIKVPSDDDEQRGEDNDAAIYGMDYGDLLYSVESLIVKLVERAKTEDHIVGEWGEQA